MAIFVGRNKSECEIANLTEYMSQCVLNGDPFGRLKFRDWGSDIKMIELERISPPMVTKNLINGNYMKREICGQNQSRFAKEINLV